MPNQAPQNYSGQTFNQPIMVNGNVLTNPQITIPREPYLLERYYFEKLIKNEGPFLTLANILLGAVIGLFINMVAKFIGSKIDNNILFENWELYAFLISLVLMIVCYIIHYCIPNERRNIIKILQQHFENS